MRNIPKIAQETIVKEFIKMLNTISYVDETLFLDDDLLEHPLDDGLDFGEDYIEPFDLD